MSKSEAHLPSSEDSIQEIHISAETQDETPKTDGSGHPVSAASVDPNVFALLKTLLQTTESPKENGPDNPPHPDALSSGDTPDAMLLKMTSTLNQLMTITKSIPDHANAELPTASIPKFLASADRPKSDGPTYNPLESGSVENILDMANQAFTLLNQIQEGVSKPNPKTLSEPGPANTVTSPSPTNALSAIVEALSQPSASSVNKNTNPEQQKPAQQSPPSGFDSRSAMLSGVTRAYQSNELLLRQSIQQISRHLITVPEDDESYPLLQATLGLTFLHLYEIKWDNAIMDAGVGGTSLALVKLLRLPPIGRARFAPSVVRSWAYGQRLLVQRDGDVDKLRSTVSTLKSCWDIYKDLDVLQARVKMFLQTELALCLLDQYRSTGDLGDLNSSIDHLTVLLKDNDTETFLGLALGTACYERFLHCGDTNDLDNTLHQGQKACDTAFDFSSSIATTTEYDADSAAGHHLFALGLVEQFKSNLDVNDLDRAVTQCGKAVNRLHPSHPLRPSYKSSLALMLYARYEATQDRKDMDSALQVIQAAVNESKAVIGRHLRVPLETIQGYLAVMSIDAKISNVPAIEVGIAMIAKSRKAFSGAAHIESRIESYLSKSFLHLFRASNSAESVVPEEDKRDHFDSALDHAILAFEKAPDNSPYRHQFGLDMGRLILEKYQAGHLPDCDEAIAQFCTTALSYTWPSIRLEAAIQWADALGGADPEGALDALCVALDVLPSLASLGERMPTQYKILSKQRSVIPQRAAMYAIDANNLVKAVSCLEKGRNIMWAQTLQLRAGHMLPAGDVRQKEFKSLAGHILGQRQQQLPRSPEELEEAMRHFPPERMNQISPILNLVRPLMSSYSEVVRQMVQLGGEERVNRNFAMMNEFRENFGDIYRTAALHGTAKRWNELLSEFDELRGALSFDEQTQKDLASILKATDGSVVILNVSRSRCDGIVISAAPEHSEVLTFSHLPFHGIFPDEIHASAEGLREGMEALGVGDLTLDKYESEVLMPVLRKLWEGVACPILEHFAQSKETSIPKRRIWWYPTGRMMFLPIHAASPCEGDDLGLLDLFISSYIPSINSLIRASKSPLLPLNILAVGQPETPELSRLLYAEKEINGLKRMLRETPERLTSLMGEEGKIYPVISSIPNHTALHLSCHAHQDEEYPFNSAFYFHDGSLKLSKIMSLDLLKVQFAYLSACLTSAGDAALPDESIHLAAGMQFAGVGSVVATMWSVEDRVAAGVSSKVYGHLLKNGVEKADTRQSAQALHEAIAAAVRKAEIPLTFIVPFIHLGI